jgi:hypothetical protein
MGAADGDSGGGFASSANSSVGGNWNMEQQGKRQRLRALLYGARGAGVLPRHERRWARAAVP